MEEAQLCADKEEQLSLQGEVRHTTRMQAVRSKQYRLNRPRAGELLCPLQKRKYRIPFQQFLSHDTDHRLIFDFNSLKAHI